jgi:hypothetical protein
MNLREELTLIRDKYIDELRMLISFFKTTDKSLTRKLNKKDSVSFEVAGMEEMTDLIHGAAEGKNNPLLDAIDQVVLKAITPIKHKSYLYEMGLSYLISFQEAMLKDYLYQIFLSKKASLKSGNQITYQEVLSYKSIKALINGMAQKEVDKLGYGSIDDVAKYYKEKFNIDFLDYEGWDGIVEASFRRNLFIHNKGKTNNIYCKRIGHKKRGENLYVDIEYITSLGENLIAFSEFCYRSFVEKFNLA